jgi:hypothetical protein
MPILSRSAWVVLLGGLAACVQAARLARTQSAMRSSFAEKAKKAIAESN